MPGSNSPDLQSILATLSQFTSRQATPPSHESEHPNESHLGVSQVASPDSLRDPPSHDALPPWPALQRSNDPRPRPQGHNVPTVKPIDPATITSWQEGIRCVTKIAAQNTLFAAAIRKARPHT
nr:hypothetical protein CFP56_10302 [Quercus suber]